MLKVVRETPTSGIPEILNQVRNIMPFDITPLQGVYFLFLNEEIVYVGQSKDIRSRIAQHTNEGKKQFNRVFYQLVPNEDQLLRVEKYWIMKFRPRYNYETHAKTCERKITKEEHAEIMARHWKYGPTPHYRLQDMGVSSNLSVNG